MIRHTVTRVHGRATAAATLAARLPQPGPSGYDHALELSPARIVLRLLLVATVVGAAALAAVWWRRRDGRHAARLVAVVAGGVLLLGLGLALGLLQP